MFTQNGRTYMFTDDDFSEHFDFGRRGDRQQGSRFQDLIWPVLQQLGIFAAIWWFVRAALQSADDEQESAAKPSQSPRESMPGASMRKPQRRVAHDVATTHAPHLCCFDGRFLRQRARRTVVCFPEDAKSALEWQMLEQLAVEFRTDPLSFTWVDLKADTAWAAFLESEFGGVSRPFLVAIGSSGTTGAAFFRAEDGKPITPLSPVREQAARWLLRIVEGTESLNVLEGEIPDPAMTMTE